MRKSLILLLLLATMSVARGQTYTYRYWLDRDFTAVGTGTATSEGAEFDLNIASLSAGLHAIRLQARNESGKWGPAFTRYFFIPSKIDQTLVKGRYWFDKDQSTMHEDVAASGVIDVDISGLSAGLHMIYYQNVNANGDYSPARCRFFSIPDKTDMTAVKGRYWFDNNQSTMHENVGAGGLIDIDVSELSEGIHMIHYQNVTANGDYSPVRSRFFSVIRPVPEAKSVKLWIDDAEPTEYDLPEEELLIDISDISIGTHELHVVLLDTNGDTMDEVTQEFEVSSPITITADNLEMEYGDSIPKLTYIVEGGELIGTPKLSCEATRTSTVGTYQITVSKGTVENNNVTCVAGKLTINQAPLTISAGTYTKKQYDPMPEIVPTYDGFKNEETEAVLTKQAIISCAANEDSIPGEYAITLSGAEATNYDISYVAGKLIVTEPDSFTLAYIVDGELYKSFFVKYKEAITPLEEPTKEGYTFSGWSEIPETMPAHDVTITGTFTLDTGIHQIMSDEIGDAMIFMVDGRRVSKPQKNLNIIRMKDGTTRKIMKK